jgi:hypothetical protein
MTKFFLRSTFPVALAVSLAHVAASQTPAPAIRSLAAASPAVYAGTAGGGLLRSGDGGSNWAPVAEVTCAGGIVSDVALGEDQKRVFVSCGDFQVLAFDGTAWKKLAPGIPNNPVDPGPGRPRLHDDPLNDEKPTYLTGSSSFSYDTYLEFSWIRTGSSLAAGGPYRFGALLPVRLLAPSSEFSPWAIWTRANSSTPVETDVLRSLARQHSLSVPNVADEERIGFIPDDAVVALSRERGRPERLVAGGRVGAWISADEGRTWTLGAVGAVSAVAVDRTAPGRYAVAGDGLRWTADAGASWMDVPAAPSDVTALAFDEVEPTLLWIGRSDGSVSSTRLLGPFSSLAGRPTLISAREESGALTVRFTARADDTFSVRVERRTYGTGVFVPVGSVSLFDPFSQAQDRPRAGALRDVGAPTDTSLGYRVVAISSVGAESPSDEIFAVLPTTEPLSPGGLTSEPEGSGFRLRWADLSGREQGYLVEFEAQDGTFRPWAVVPANTTSVRVEASLLSSGFYRVASFNARGRLDATPPTIAGGVPPVAPSLDGSGGVNANFLNVSTTDTYVDAGVLERSIDDSPFATIAVIPSTSRSSYQYVDGSLSPDHDVVYRARFSNLAGPGPYSASVSLATFNSEPDLVPGFEASYVPGAPGRPGEEGLLSLKWGEVKREDFFQLFDDPLWAYIQPYQVPFATAPRNATSFSMPAFRDGDHVLWVRARNSIGYADSPGFRLRAFANWAESIAPTPYSQRLALHLTPVVVQAPGPNGALFTTTTTSAATSPIRVLDMASDSLLSDSFEATVTISDFVVALRKDYPGLPQGPFVGGMISYVPSGFGPNQIRVTTPVAVGDRVGRPGVVFNSVPFRLLPDSAVVLPGLRQDTSFRSNVAVVHPGLTDDPLILRVTAVDGATGRSVALPDVTLRRAEWKQIAGVLATAGFPAPARGWVRVERIEGSSPFYAYAVVNEATTSDGSFVVPAAAGGADGLPGMIVPLVLETPELETEISVTNESASPLDLALEYHESIPSESVVSSAVTVAPGRQVFLPAFVDGLRRTGASLGVRGASGRYGSLRIRRSDGKALTGLAVSARLATLDGRFGTFVGGIPQGTGTEGSVVEGNTSQPDGTTIVSWLPATADATSDAFVLNAGPDSVSVCTSMRDPFVPTLFPCPEERVRTLGPGALLRLERPVDPTGRDIGVFLAERFSGTGPLYAFGLLTDVVTRDPGFWEGSGVEP